MFWEQEEITLGGVEHLELRLVRRWIKRVSHYDISETGTSIRNVKEEKTLHLVETRSRDPETRCVE